MSAGPDRKWLVFFSLGGVALFVIGVSLFPNGLVGHNDWQQTSNKMHARPLCPARNEALTRFSKAAQNADRAGTDYLLPHTATTLPEFLVELKTSLDRHMLDERAHLWLFNEDIDHQRVHPSCAGDWMEFGVYTGGSVNLSAIWRRSFCGPGCAPVYGFDTFTGLPEVWSQDGGAGTFGGGAFSTGGKFPPVEYNVQLVKGLFSESLPPFLRMQAEMKKRVAEPTPLGYLHVDCDLYVGTKDIFTILDKKIVPGTVILFDELVNYKLYKEHEVKAFFEWLRVSKAKVAAIGVKGPIEKTDFAMEIDIDVREHHQHNQGVAFVVISRPGATQSIGIS
ncbi:hypothetical protein WJX73_002614 [Symbiochloris irregularis]|uniref:Uncharacterized protein n=1 Tax=Symbiochloris irregularis TaxID=706552 RepID=A0AAW1NQD1_9CHLO